jgi:hypothetical protein
MTLVLMASIAYARLKNVTKSVTLRGAMHFFAQLSSSELKMSAQVRK